MKIFLAALLFSTTIKAQAQDQTDPWLEKLLRSKASRLLQHVLNNRDSFQYQLIYTQINRDKKNKPSFRNYYLHVDSNRYFNPASMVKLPVAAMALEKLNRLHIPGVNKFTTMFTDSSYEKQTPVYKDSLAEDKLPSVAQYIREIFLVSDNDAYSRLYEFVGQQELNEALWKKGYKNSRITRRFVAMNEEQNRHTNRIRFIKNDSVLCDQPPAYNASPFDFSKKILVGNAHINRQDQLVNAPMDFTTHNLIPLEDLRQMLQSILFPNSVPVHQRFQLTQEDYRFLYQYMSEYPSESKFPFYDTSEFFDSYTKFFFFKAGRGRIPAYIRSFNKTGWSYGFLTDVSYIVDFKHNIEFMLSGVIYVNSDGILNDDNYEYESIGYPFFKEVGEIIYLHELKRARKYKPDLSEFKLTYH